MIFNFKCPLHGIPCTAEYNEEGRVLMFDFEDYEAASNMFSIKEVNEVREWCMSSHINCDSLQRANFHLSYLGLIKNDFIEVKTYKLDPN